MPSTKTVASPHRRTTSLQKTKIIINCYDLLPPSNLTTALWACGLSLLHSGVVIGTREYAYGGHDRPNLTGVYWTAPTQAPPGSVHRAELHHGFTILSESEIQAIVHEASKKFLGTDWNLLSRNCNHFTSYLCEELTGMPAPAWLNRAAAVGVRLPCLLPREFVRAPGVEQAALGAVNEEEEESDEEGHLLARSRSRESYLVQSDEDDEQSSSEEEQNRHGDGDAEYTSDESDEEEQHRPRGTKASLSTHLTPPSPQSSWYQRQNGRKRRPIDTSGRVVPLRRRDRLKTHVRSRIYHHLRSPHACRWHDVLLFMQHWKEPETVEQLRQRWEQILAEGEAGGEGVRAGSESLGGLCGGCNWRPTLIS